MVNFRLKEIVLSIASGITINHSSKGTYPVYGSTGIIGYTNSNDYSGERILIARVGANAGATNIVCGEYGVSDNTLVITVNSEYETKYIYYFLKHKKLNQFVFGSGQPLITGSLLKNISLYIPDRISQQHIAEALSDVDGMISSLEKLIAKYKSIKTACLQQMFPQNGETVPRMRLPGFTGAWEQRKAIDIADYSKGNGYSKGDLIDVGTPIILYGRLYTKYQFAISEVDTFTVPRNGAVYSQGNEVIVPASGETAEDIARASAVEKSGVLLGGDLNILRPFDFINPLFLALAISNGEPQKELAKKAQGKSVVHIHNTDIQEVTIAYPSRTEQDRIVSVFRQLDNLITLHQRKSEKVQKIKQGMMQQLLTGKIRLV